MCFAKLHPFNAHIWKLPSPKSLFVDKYENDTHAPVYYQYDTYVAEFHKKRVVVSDSPVPVKKIDIACKSNISILKKKITKMLVLT
jgi:hypothetical protein